MASMMSLDLFGEYFTVMLVRRYGFTLWEWAASGDWTRSAR